PTLRATVNGTTRRTGMVDKPFDVAAFVERHHIDARGPEDWTPRGGGRGKRWILPVCPFCAEHDDDAAYIVQFASGALDAGCHHEGCSWGWAELRAHFEPKPAASRGTNGVHRNGTMP